jgi:hypothetical protein
MAKTEVKQAGKPVTIGAQRYAKMNAHLPYFQRKCCRGLSLAKIHEIGMVGYTLIEEENCCPDSCKKYCVEGTDTPCDDVIAMVEDDLMATLYKRVSENGYEIPKLLDNQRLIDLQIAQVDEMNQEACKVIGMVEKLIAEMESYKEYLISDDMFYNYDEMAVDVGYIRGDITCLGIRMKRGLIKMAQEFNM